MAIAPIRLYPDAVLRKKSLPVKKITPDIHNLIHALISAMNAHKHGIGIAAPQIGVLKQIAIVDVSSRVPRAKRLVLINPRLVSFNHEIRSREGCMSLPEYTADLKRYLQIRVRYLDPQGKLQQKECEGIEAVCVQHELDHLEGMLFFDHVTSLKTGLYPRK